MPNMSKPMNKPRTPVPSQLYKDNWELIFGKHRLTGEADGKSNKQDKHVKPTKKSK